MTKSTSKSTQTTPPPLVAVLQQCNQEGTNPSQLTAWEDCLQEVFQSRNYNDTATGFVSAINQVWGPQVNAQLMLSAVTGLEDGSKSHPFTEAIVQPLINALLATFLIRDNLNDVGGQSASPYWISPDIINYGTDMLTVTEATNSMSSYINTSFNNGQNNNMYIRTRNISNTAASGYVSIYSVPASLLLTPQSWLPFAISQPSSAESFYDASNAAQIQPTEIGLTTTPFTYMGPPSGGHFCLIAVASGANGMPFSIPTGFSSNAQLAAWVEGNPNVSQRNMDYAAISGTIGTMSVTVGNSNNKASGFIVAMKPGSNQSFPVGTMVSVSITDSRAPYSPPPQQWAQAGISFYGLTVPANITGTPQSPLINMTITIQLPTGTSFANTPSISIEYYQIPSTNADQTELSVVRSYKIPLYIDGQTGLAQNEESDIVETEDVPLILLGMCNFNFQ